MAADSDFRIPAGNRKIMLQQWDSAFLINAMELALFVCSSVLHTFLFK